MSVVPKTKMRWRRELYSCCADLTAFRIPRTAFRFTWSRACGHIHRHYSGSPNRHSGANRNLGRAVTFTVIPAQTGIQGVWSYSPSFRLPQPSFRPPNRHSGASRNPGRAVTFAVIQTPPTIIPAPPNRHSGSPSTVIPAQAGIQGVRSYSPSFRLPLNRHSGFRRNDGCRGIAITMKTYAGLW